MSVHWRELDTEGKIEAIRSVWEPGMSASQIASCFDGATRNAIIGFFHRHAGKMDARILRPSDNREPGPQPKVRLTNRSAVPRRKTRQPMPVFDTTTEPHLCGRPLVMLKSRGECKWPVNDAEKGEEHLFCGKEAEGAYCAHHASRAYRSAA